MQIFLKLFWFLGFSKILECSWKISVFLLQCWHFSLGHHGRRRSCSVLLLIKLFCVQLFSFFLSFLFALIILNFSSYLLCVYHSFLLHTVSVALSRWSISTSQNDYGKPRQGFLWLVLCELSLQPLPDQGSPWSRRGEEVRACLFCCPFLATRLAFVAVVLLLVNPTCYIFTHYFDFSFIIFIPVADAFLLHPDSSPLCFSLERKRSISRLIPVSSIFWWLGFQKTLMYSSISSTWFRYPIDCSFHFQ